jgi:DNA repair exonuclease SbcCD nuclease subunit
MKLAQLSDIHSGSFFNKTAVKGGIEMLLNEKPDAIFFTGDLVNNEAKEVQDYIDVFSKVKAPLGVFSTLGNHDYGDYIQWDSAEAKVQNLKDLKEAHRLMGWDLLLDENRKLTVDGERNGRFTRKTPSLPRPKPLAGTSFRKNEYRRFFCGTYARNAIRNRDWKFSVESSAIPL